jgi:hypothetical protein
MIKLHPQLQQLVNLLLLLIVGKYVAHIYLTWKAIMGILLFTFLLDHIFYYIRNKTVDFISFSSLSTAIGVILMMVTTHYAIYFIVLFFALLQKQFLHYNKHHFFNPSNFALITGLLFFYNDAHLVLGQLGHEVWFIWAISIVAAAILFRIDRWILPVGFVLLYMTFQYFMIANTDPVILMEDIYHRFYSVSFVVFILFMLTDPKTTPSKIWGQILFAVAIAFFTTLLDYSYGFRVQHLFIVLFFCSPWVVLLEQYSKALDKKALILMSFTVIVLALSAIIYIQMQAPYYFEMDK